MAFTADEIRREAEMFIEGAGQSRSAYLHILDGIAKFHKYPLEQQATLSYAPANFTAVAETRIWEKKFHVRVKANAVGVALADSAGMKTVYDASETEGWSNGKQPELLWRFNAERDSGVFRGIADENASAMDALLQACWNVEDLYNDSQKSGEERLLLSASLAYVLMKRLGFDHEAEIHAEQTLTDEMIQSATEVPLQEVSDISREILNGIQDYMQKRKGRGEAFPLENAILRVQKYVRERMNAETRQENSSVEAPETKAASATAGAAAPEEAGVSPESPAQTAATDDALSVTADIPVIADKRRFAISPDGVDIAEYTHTVDSNVWGVAGKLPENYIAVRMDYMSNGRIDVNIRNSVTKDEDSFVSYDHDGLSILGRKVFSEIVPDGNADMLSAWLVQHAILMERRTNAVSRDHQSVPPLDEAKELDDFLLQQNQVSTSDGAAAEAQNDWEGIPYPGRVVDDAPIQLAEILSNVRGQEESSVEAPATEAASATVGAAAPEATGAPSEPPAQTAATDDSSPVAATEQGELDFSNSVIDDTGIQRAEILSDARQVVSEMNIPVYYRNSYHPNSDEWGVISGENAGSGDIDIRMRLMDDDSVFVTVRPVSLGIPEVSFAAKDLAELRTKGVEAFKGIDDRYSRVPWLLSSRYSFLRQKAHQNTSFDSSRQDHLIGFHRHMITSSGDYSYGPQQSDDDVEFQMSLRSNGNLDVYMRKGSGEETGFTAFGQSEVFNKAKESFAKLLPGSDSSVLASVVLGKFRTMVQDSNVPEFLGFEDFSATKEDSSVEAPVTEAASAVMGAAAPGEAGASPEPPAQTAATDDSSSVAASEQGEAEVVGDAPKFHGGKKGEAFQRNIAAIVTLKSLEGNPSTSMSPLQRNTLLGYSGFGNLPEAFDTKNESWKPEHDLLEKVLTREEYAAARASVLNSYYTDPAIVSVIYDGLADMGFAKGNILEPSCGVGNFFRAMPEDMRKDSHLFGVELDPISGRIARQLYPDAHISIQGFETTTYPEGSFDLAITNVPFENYKIHGYSVHDYFLLKMAQQVRPGGLMVAITSRYSMDKKDSGAREELARRADLVKAIRLPNTAFREAGAEATTDILILRRREHNLEYGDALPSWVGAVPFEGNPDILVNPYFLQHPEDVIGSLEKKSTAYGFDLTCKPVEGKRETGEIATEIARAMASIRAEYIPAKNELPVPQQKQDDNATPYSFFVDGGEVRFRDTDSDHIKTLADLGIDEKDKAQLFHLIRIRDLTREVIHIQQASENDDALRMAQEKLNAVYDDYAETYGTIHAKKAKQIFGEDCAYPLLLSMEQTDEKGNVVGKSDIFTRRTIRPHIPPSHVDTAQEALIVSMTEHGKVDMPYMEKLTGKSAETLATELEFHEMFWDYRTREYQPADEYLSGDIRQKMEWLEQNIEFTKRRRDRDVWDSLLPQTLSDEDAYIPKNETEERILSEKTTYRYTEAAIKYMDASRDWPFFFAYLSKYDSVYHLPDAATSDPLFVLEAGLRAGDHADDTEGLVILSDVISAMDIEGLATKKQPPDYESPVLQFLAEGSEAEYPQKRACVHYLRNLMKNYDGTNAKELAERARSEWPSVWRDWQQKFDAALEKGELLGMERMNKEIERSEKNLVALKAVCPKDLAAEDISVRLGTPWVPVSDIEDFMRDTFGASEKIEYSNADHGEWHIRSAHARSYRFSDSRPMAKAFSTPEYDALALLELTLNLRQAVVRKTVYINGEEKEVIDQEKTVLAQQKQEMLKDAFAKWVWQDEERKERLVNYYNRHFNNIRPREFDGSHLAFPGMNPEIQLKPHQKDAIAHTLYGGNTLLAHCVGAGKTFEMIASIMESKRLGLSTKSMLVVPGHLTEQTGAEFLRLYPTANILVATKKDFEKARRKEFCAKIATHNWDAVILGFTQFEKVAMSKEYIHKFTQDEINRLSAEIEIAKEKEGKSFGVREMERLRKSLEGKLAALEDKKARDDVVDFESLGIDRLYVDEAHNFKNLGVITKLTRLPGISTTPAQKSTDFYQKVQYLNDKTNGKGLVFATGTAISNSMTELYVMQQYLQPDRLDSEGVRHFDTWATTFGEIANVQELNPEGKGIRVRQRFAKFCNLPELMSMVKEFADIKTADMLDLPTPNVEYHVESVPASPEQKAMVDGLADRAMKIRNKQVDTKLPENNMLSVTNEGRKLALDQRLMNPDLPDYPDSKVNRCVANVFRIWEETKDRNGTQLVFSDFSTPDSKKFNVYDDIKAKLVAQGVPAEEIAFIHDATNEKQKEELFAKVRAGKVRVLLGSTGKLGTGTNVQDKLVASHDLDVPWKPSDLEQRKGRIARQGNENEKVDVYRYVTEGTFDSYMWQILENKQRFISQVLTSKSPARVTEDVDELVLSCAEVKAIATGSPLIREKMELGVEVERLRIARKGFRAEEEARKRYVEQEGAAKIAAIKAYQKAVLTDISILSTYPCREGEPKIRLEGKTFADDKEAGKAIVEAIRAGRGEELRGFYKGLSFRLNPGFKWQMELRGQSFYTADVHMGDYAENIERLKTLEKQILEDLPKKLEDDIHAEEKRIEEAKALLGQSFSKEDEYQQKLMRLQELDVLLSEENANNNDMINDEVQRRYDALKILAEDGDSLESAYAEMALGKVAYGVKWSETEDREIARELFARGFERKEIAAMLMKRSPKMYDAEAAEAVVSSEQRFQKKMAACR